MSELKDVTLVAAAEIPRSRPCKQMGRATNVGQIVSTDWLVLLQFDLNRDIDGARRAGRHQRRPRRAAGKPETNPTYRKVNPADAPILILAMTSKTLTQGQYDAASDVLQQQLSQIGGIGQVIIGGSALPAVRVTSPVSDTFKTDPDNDFSLDY